MCYAQYILISAHLPTCYILSLFIPQILIEGIAFGASVSKYNHHTTIAKSKDTGRTADRGVSAIATRAVVMGLDVPNDFVSRLRVRKVRIAMYTDDIPNKLINSFLKASLWMKS